MPEIGEIVDVDPFAAATPPSPGGGPQVGDVVDYDPFAPQTNIWGEIAEVGRGIPAGAVQAAGTALRGLAANQPTQRYASYLDEIEHGVRYRTREREGRLPITDDTAYTDLLQRIADDPGMFQSQQLWLRHAIEGVRSGNPEALATARSKLPAEAVQERELWKAGEAVSEFAREQFPAAPGYEESLGRAVGEGLGSLGAGLVTAVVPGVGTGLSTAFFTAMGSGEAADRAVAAGATDEQIIRAAGLGAGAGATDILPAEMLLGRIPGANIVANAVKRYGGKRTMQALGRISNQAIVESAQEAGQQTLQNLIAQEIHSPETNILEGVVENAGIGGIVGGIAGLGREGVLQLSTRRSGSARGDRARAVREVPPPSPADEASPIPTADIIEGRERIADAEATDNANKYLDVAGLPQIGQPVRVARGRDVIEGVVADAWEGDDPGLTIRAVDGTETDLSLAQMQAMGAALTGLPMPAPRAEIAKKADEIAQDAQRVREAQAQAEEEAAAAQEEQRGAVEPDRRREVDQIMADARRAAEQRWERGEEAPAPAAPAAAPEPAEEALPQLTQEQATQAARLAREGMDPEEAVRRARGAMPAQRDPTPMEAAERAMPAAPVEERGRGPAERPVVVGPLGRPEADAGPPTRPEVTGPAGRPEPDTGPTARPSLEGIAEWARTQGPDRRPQLAGAAEWAQTQGPQTRAVLENAAEWARTEGPQARAVLEGIAEWSRTAGPETRGGVEGLEAWARTQGPETRAALEGAAEWVRTAGPETRATVESVAEWARAQGPEGRAVLTGIAEWSQTQGPETRAVVEGVAEWSQTQGPETRQAVGGVVEWARSQGPTGRRALEGVADWARSQGPPARPSLENIAEWARTRGPDARPALTGIAAWSESRGPQTRAVLEGAAEWAQTQGPQSRAVLEGIADWARTQGPATRPVAQGVAEWARTRGPETRAAVESIAEWARSQGPDGRAALEGLAEWARTEGPQGRPVIQSVAEWARTRGPETRAAIDGVVEWARTQGPSGRAALDGVVEWARTEGPGTRPVLEQVAAWARTQGPETRKTLEGVEEWARSRGHEARATLESVAEWARSRGPETRPVLIGIAEWAQSRGPETRSALEGIAAWAETQGPETRQALESVAEWARTQGPSGRQALESVAEWARGQGPETRPQVVGPAGRPEADTGPPARPAVIGPGGRPEPDAGPTARPRVGEEQRWLQQAIADATGRDMTMARAIAEDVSRLTGQDMNARRALAQAVEEASGTDITPRRALAEAVAAATGKDIDEARGLAQAVAEATGRDVDARRALAQAIAESSGRDIPRERAEALGADDRRQTLPFRALERAPTAVELAEAAEEAGVPPETAMQVGEQVRDALRGPEDVAPTPDMVSREVEATGLPADFGDRIARLVAERQGMLPEPLPERDTAPAAIPERREFRQPEQPPAPRRLPEGFDERQEVARAAVAAARTVRLPESARDRLATRIEELIEPPDLEMDAAAFDARVEATLEERLRAVPEVRTLPPADRDRLVDEVRGIPEEVRRRMAERDVAPRPAATGLPEDFGRQPERAALPEPLPPPQEREVTRPAGLPDDFAERIAEKVAAAPEVRGLPVGFADRIAERVAAIPDVQSIDTMDLAERIAALPEVREIPPDVRNRMAARTAVEVRRIPEDVQARMEARQPVAAPEGLPEGFEARQEAARAAQAERLAAVPEIPVREPADEPAALPPASTEVERAEGEAELSRAAPPPPIMRKDGSPFQTRQGAVLAARNKKIEAEPIEVEGGWALQQAAAAMPTEPAPAEGQEPAETGTQRRLPATDDTQVRAIEAERTTAEDADQEGAPDEVVVLEGQEAMFQRTPGPPLRATHSLSIPNLRSAVERGTLIGPSVAVTPAEVPHQWGGPQNVEVVFKAGAVKPGKWSITRGDAWTATVPQVTTRIKSHAAQRRAEETITRDFNEVAENIRAAMPGHMADIADGSERAGRVLIDGDGSIGENRRGESAAVLSAIYLQETGGHVPDDIRDVERAPEFDAWRKRYIGTLPQAEEMIFAGTSDVTGRQRWVPATTKNLLKDMRRLEREESGTVAFGGHGKIWARWRPNITGMRELRGEAARVTRDEAEYERQKDVLTQEILDIGRQIAQAVGRGDGAFSFGTGLDILMEAGPNEARLNRVASEYADEPVELPSYLIDEIQEHFEKVGRMPLQFLEAKRIAEIPLSDVAAVVVPRVFPKTLRDQIEAQGIEVREKREDMSDEELAEVQSIPSALFKRAWHGSPHRFDRFSTEGIGSGEGAQAYGWGLYFADRKGVAEWYKQNLGQRAADALPDDIYLDGEIIGAPDAQGFSEFLNRLKIEPTIAAAIARQTQEGDYRGYKAPTTIDAAASDYANSILSRSDPPATMAEVRAVMSARDTIRKAKRDGRMEKPNPATIYQVTLAPKDSEYLLWDRTFENQPDGVRKALAQVVPGTTPDTLGLRGDEAYRVLSNRLGSDRAASETLLAAGVRGIKYLDGSSRTAGEGSFNYVIFDDSDVAIEEIIYQRLQAQQDRAGGAGQAAARVRIRLNRRYDEAREGVRGDLERIGRETFGQQFRFELAESITAPEGGQVPGAFDPANRIAYIALRADEAGMTGSLYHEGIHYLRSAGAFDKADGTPNAAWQTLERQAAQWRQDYGIDERYAGDVGAMDPEARERLLNEESIAEALADYATRGRETGFGPTVRMALNRILRFFRALREGLRGRGFQTWEDVFEGDIGRGRAGERADAAGRRQPLTSEQANALREHEEQFEFRFDDPITTEPAGRAASAVSPAAGRRVERLAETRLVSLEDARVGVTRIASPEDAAHVFAPFRKEPTESLVAAAVDGAGKVLGLIRHSVGTTSSTPVEISVLTGSVLQIPGAKGFWMSHQHPSGVAVPSQADVNMSREIERVTRDTGLRYYGGFVVAPGETTATFIEPTKRATMQPVDIRPAARRTRVPVYTRRWRKVVGNKDRVSVGNYSEAESAAAKHLPERSGLLLLDSRNRLVGSITLAPTEMTSMRGSGAAVDTLRAIAETNATAAVGFVPEGSGAEAAARNVLRFGRDVSAGGGFVVHAVQRLSDAGTAIHEHRRDEVDTAAREADRYLQTAWHGSPHRFDEFSTAAIGTGEGAQVYGFGLYFADRRGVADWYRAGLARENPVIELRGERQSPGSVGFHIGDKMSEGATFEAARDDARRWIDRRIEGYEEDLANLILDDSMRADLREGLSDAVRQRDLLEAIKEEDVRVQMPGATYRVDLAPKDRDYLYWDRRLDLQSRKVRKAMNAVWARQHPGETMNRGEHGGEAYDMLARELGSQRAASEALLAEGVRGIKYLDQASRPMVGLAGRARMPLRESFNYVIFDDSDVAIQEIMFQRQRAGQPVEDDPRPMDEAATESAAFKRWFGNSKVVNEDGSPMRLFHGGRLDETQDGVPSIPYGGMFFTSDRELAASYGQRGQVTEAYLKLENPFDQQNPDHVNAPWVREWIESWREDGWVDRFSGEEMSDSDVRTMIETGNLPAYDETYSNQRWHDFLAAARGHHDGYIGRDPTDQVGLDAPEIFVVFSPEQVKSVNNRGTFDIASPNILFQRAAKEDPKAFDKEASDWSGVDLTGAAEEVVKDKDRMGGFAEEVKAGLKGTTAVQDPRVQVTEEKTHKDLNLAWRFLAPPLAWSKKYPAIHSLIKQGVETEKSMSNRIQRLNRDWDRITKPLNKDEFAQLTGIMFLGDAEAVTFTDEQLGRFNTTEKVRAAYKESRKFLDKIGRFTEQHERAMALPLLTRRTTLVRQMAGERGMDKAEFRALYNARAELLAKQRRGEGHPQALEFEIAEATEALFGKPEAPSDLFEDRLKEADRLETRIADTKVRRREGYVPHKFFGRWRIFQAAQPNDEIEPYMGRGGTGFKDRAAAEKVAEASEGGILEGATPVQVDGKWGLTPKWKEVAGEHGMWKTRTDAVRAASHMAREGAEGAEIRVVPVEFEFPHDSATTLGDAAYFTFRSKVEELTGLSGEALQEFVTGVARRPFRRRIAGFLQYRTGMTGYSLDLDRVMRTHVGETVRYVSLDRLKFDAINTIEKEGLSAYRSSIQDRPVLAAAVQAWFRDVNGQKQQLESQLDNVLNKSWVTPLRAGLAAGALGFLAAGGPFNAPISPIVGAYVGYRVGRGLAQGGDFKTRAITGSMLGDMAHLKLGAFFNLMSALVNTSQVPLNTLPVLGVRDTTEGMIRYQKAVLSKLRGRANADWRFLERMDINPLDTFAEGTRHKFKKESKLSKVSMVFFSTAEGFNRGVTALGALNKAQRKGWSHGKAKTFADETLDRTQFHYGASDKPELLRNVVLRVPLQFKNFVSHQLSFVFGLNRKELPLFLLSMALTAGALGIPGLDFVDTLTDWLFDFSPIAMMKEAALDAAVEGELEGGIATFLTRGVPGLAGVDMTGRVGMGDKFLPMQFRDWKGPWISTVENAVRHGREEAHWTHQMRNLSPGLGNPLVVLDAWQNGGQVRSPWKRNRPEYVATETELMQKLAGARPIREARLQDLRDIERRNIEDYRTDTRRYVDRIVLALNRGDRAAARAVMQEALDAGIPISSGTIRRGIQDYGTQRALREFDRLPRTMKPEGMGRRQAIERMAQ